jgi:cyclopropane fatty-acyl-phospholipid synthase-like methyltransferase
MKPYSQSCEENQEPILAVLKKVFADRKRVLEIGSGTGQHAVFFGLNLPHLKWQTSDLPENHKGIQAWLEEAALPNVLPPLAIDAKAASWPVSAVDAIFSANAVHIMGWSEVEAMFAGIGRVLLPGGVLCLYGPFNYGGKSGVRDFEMVNALAEAIGLSLVEDHAMPANNRTLVWKRAD